MSRSKKYIWCFVLLFLIGISIVVLYINNSLEKNLEENIIENTQ